MLSTSATPSSPATRVSYIPTSGAALQCYRRLSSLWLLLVHTTLNFSSSLSAVQLYSHALLLKSCDVNQPDMQLCEILIAPQCLAVQSQCLHCEKVFSLYIVLCCCKRRPEQGPHDRGWTLLHCCTHAQPLAHPWCGLLCTYHFDNMDPVQPDTPVCAKPTCDITSPACW